MYRYFISPFEEVEEQFVRNYGKEKVQTAKNNKEFINIIEDNDILNIYDIIIIFSEILKKDENLRFLMSITHRYRYIIIVCKNNERGPLSLQIKNMRKIKNLQNN
jgi:hypothetical protein